MTVFMEIIDTGMSPIYKRIIGVYKHYDNAKTALIDRMIVLRDQGFMINNYTTNGFWYRPVPNGFTCIYLLTNVLLYGDKITDNKVYHLILSRGPQVNKMLPLRYTSIGWFTDRKYIFNTDLFEMYLISCKKYYIVDGQPWLYDKEVNKYEDLFFLSESDPGSMAIFIDEIRFLD